VHISWLRKAIEDNPRDPKYLITVRSKGYLLDV
jgi:DNA-binding response OmpR family regulator